MRDDGHDQPELVTARNDLLINPHNRLQLQGWWANVDLKPILSIHVALQYISKYASKSKSRSAAFSEIFNQIISTSQEDETSLTTIQKLLLHSVSERDISAQETTHLLLGIPLYHSSRLFISLNLNKEAPRWLRGTGGNEEGVGTSLGNDVGHTGKSPLKNYWDRPEEFEDFSLYKLNLTHKFVNGYWKKYTKENIVRIWSRLSPVHQGPHWEEFCRVKVLLHVRHRNIEQLTENGDIGHCIVWSTLYDHFIEEISKDPSDLLGPAVDNEEEIIAEEEELEEENEDDQDEYRPDWMILSKMGPNATIKHSSDLGSRDMDRNHDWLSDGK